MTFSFNYSVSDIREPDKRQTEYSKTVTCPGTANNNELFGHVFSVTIANPFDPNTANVGVNFNPNKKADAQVLHNSIPVMSGSMQLRKVKVTEGQIEYEVVFIGKLLEIFGAWGDRKMDEVTDDVDAQGNPIQKRIIDLSDLNHNLLNSNTVASWTSPIGQGYVYPLIDYGFDSNLWIGQGVKAYRGDHMRPAVYVRELWNRCFEFADATYEGMFFNTGLFDRLVIPFSTGFRLSDEERADRWVLANSEIEYLPHRSGNAWNSNYINFLFGSGPAGLVAPQTVAQDINNQYTQTPTAPAQPVTQTFIPDFNGVYVVDGNVTLGKIRTGTGSLTGPFNIEFKLFINSTEVQSVEANYGGGAGAFTNIGAERVTEIPFTFQAQQINAGDVVTVSYVLTQADWDYLNNDHDTAFLPRSESQGWNGTFIQFRAINEEPFYGDPLNMNDGIPDITIKDFITSIIKMFNLYVTPHPTIENRYIFETRDVYYSQGIIRDWTYKMARDKVIDITPMGLLAGREYLYTYAEDGDYYNERYQNNYGRTYGSRLLDVDNDFVPDRRETSIVFSPTPLANDGNSNRIIPRIYDSDISEGAKPSDTNVRILYYAGLIPSIPNWSLRDPITNADTLYSTYPYAGHWDNPITPTLDLNWGVAQEYYYQPNGATGQIQITNNNLFKAYHERQFLELSDKDSKLVTAMFNLTAADIEALDFRDTILIDQTYYRLNKVLNYNPFKPDVLTKVELFKAGDIAVANPVAKSISDVGMIGGEKAAKAPTKILTNGNQFEPFQGKVTGSNNTVSLEAVGFMIQGDGNNVGATQNVTIIGSGNYVAAGANNVKLINTNNVAVSQSNVTYLNGTNVTDGTSLLDSFALSAATTAVVTEEVLHSYTLAGHAIPAAKAVRVRASWTTATNANTKTVRIKMNGQTIYDSSAAVPTDTAPNNGRILAEFVIIRNGNTTGRAQGMATISTTGTSPVAVGTGNVTGLDWRNDQTIEITGQNGTASANDIVLQAVTIEQMQ